VRRARLSVSTVPAEIHELEKKLEEVVKEKEAAIRGPGVREGARCATRRRSTAARNELKKSWASPSARRRSRSTRT
jgi:hypothetical protein